MYETKTIIVQVATGKQPLPVVVDARADATHIAAVVAAAMKRHGWTGLAWACDISS